MINNYKIIDKCGQWQLVMGSHSGDNNDEEGSGGSNGDNDGNGCRWENNDDDWW